MSGKRLQHGLAALALGVITVLGVPAAANAADSPTAGSKTTIVKPAAAAADGYFYAWVHANRGGGYCRWYGNDTDWSNCSPAGNMRNIASDIWNNGYAGSYEDVWVYWDVNYGGAHACINNGYEYLDLSQWVFPYNGAGGGENMNDNISSHEWVNAC